MTAILKPYDIIHVKYKIMKKKVLIITGILISAVVLLLMIKPFSKKEPAVTFNTVKVERGNITNTVTATGTIEATTAVTKREQAA